jgi:hypothetical protein
MEVINSIAGLLAVYIGKVFFDVCSRTLSTLAVNFLTRTCITLHS